MSEQKNNWTVGGYLAERLAQLNLDRMFGVPGNHLGPFLSTLEKAGKIRWVGCTNEINAGFSADGYARVKGLGAVGVTYGVGALSLINTIGGAFVERVPLVVINASPTNEQWLNYKALGLLTSHMSPNKESNLNAYRQVTVSAQVISNSQLAPVQIDAALVACLTEQKPVYLEVRENVWGAACDPPEGTLSPKPRKPTAKNLKTTEAAVNAVIEMIKRLGMPIFWGGVEINRYHLEDKFQRLSERTGIPFCTTIMAKSILPEDHDNFLGVYNGKASLPIVQTIFKKIAKCRIGLGAWTTSKNLGGTQDIGQDWSKAAHEGVSVGSSYYPEVRLEDFIDGLAGHPFFKDHHFDVEDYLPIAVGANGGEGMASLTGTLEELNTLSLKEAYYHRPQNHKHLTYDLLIATVNTFLLSEAAKGQKYQVVADAGFSLLSAQSLRILEQNTFHSQASWLSIGYSLPAGLGLAEGAPDHRTFVFIGDGAFQETCQSLSSHTRLKHDTVIFVLNNEGFYGIEQMLVEPRFYKKGSGGDAYRDAYNVLHPWEYTKLAEVFATNKTPIHGHTVATDVELLELLETVNGDWEDRENTGPRIVQVCLDQKDYPKSIGYKVPK